MTTDLARLMKRVRNLETTGDFDNEVVGESFYQDSLELITGKAGGNTRIFKEALLVLENDNPHDENAIAIYIETKKIGYLSKDDACDFRNDLNEENISGVVFRCPAVIFGGGVRDGEKRNFGVALDFELPVSLKKDNPEKKGLSLVSIFVLFLMSIITIFLLVGFFSRLQLSL